MSAPPLREILSIDQEVLTLLGKTFEEIGAMDLKEFAHLSFEKGIDWKIDPTGGRVRGLTITIEHEEDNAKRA